MLWIFENAIFTIFANFWAAKSTKLFSGKVRQSIQNYLNQNLVIGIFLENGFGASLSSKTSVVSVWKRHFTIFWNVWVTKLKPFSGKVRQSVQTYLNQNLVTGSFLEYGFGATLSSKTNVLSVWKKHFSSFLQHFWVMKLKGFSGKVRESVKNCLNQILAMVNFLENDFEGTLSWKTNVLGVWKGLFLCFADFL